MPIGASAAGSVEAARSTRLGSHSRQPGAACRSVVRPRPRRGATFAERTGRRSIRERRWLHGSARRQAGRRCTFAGRSWRQCERCDVCRRSTPPLVRLCGRGCGGACGRVAGSGRRRERNCETPLTRVVALFSERNVDVSSALVPLLLAAGSDPTIRRRPGGQTALAIALRKMQRAYLRRRWGVGKILDWRRIVQLLARAEASWRRRHLLLAVRGRYGGVPAAAGCTTTH